MMPRKHANELLSQRGCSNKARMVAGTNKDKVGWLSASSSSQAVGSKRECNTTSTPASNAGKV